jgi:hypothetical protein
MGFNDRDKLPFFLGPIHLGVSWVSSEAWGAGSIVSIGLPYCFAFLASCLWVGKPRWPTGPKGIQGRLGDDPALEPAINIRHQMDPNICSTCFSSFGQAPDFDTAPGRTSQVWPACGATKRRPEREFLRHFYCTKDLQQENT